MCSMPEHGVTHLKCLQYGKGRRKTRTVRNCYSDHFPVILMATVLISLSIWSLFRSAGR